PHHSRQRASFLAVALIVASLIPVVGSRLGTVDRVVGSTRLARQEIGVVVLLSGGGGAPLGGAPPRRYQSSQARRAL
ncbi:hypothetical protein, partial [Nocardia cyriacigeorgica]|uniref:hypothetical protein n=1 Tax=Nocardia cyriacigeorgica TaxID=135487 RepID=UPI0024588C8C